MENIYLLPSHAGKRKAIPVTSSFFLLLLLLFSAGSKAQTYIVKDSPVVPGTTVVIPGKEYLRGGLHNFFWGKHYRREWGTAVRVPNFLLDTAYGGLQPIKEGGSRQSMGLRLKAKDNKEYVLRSIDKDFGNGLPDMYKGTFISKIAKDQASFGYPMAAITIAPMINATQIYHTNPKIIFVPKQAALGEYNEKYGDQLYLFEERPDDDQSDAVWFGNSKKVIGTDKLYEKVFNDNDNQVDQYAFARARLFDMFIGDWGRHADQWRWASFEGDGKTIFKPIPRDRDQAYTIFDGFYPSIAANIIGGTQLESFSDNIKAVKKFNEPGWPLDRQFTNQLSEADWIRAATELQQALTNEVIDRGMRQLPAQVYAINGETITAKLRSRRDHLQDFARRYYHALARRIMIYGSDEKEYFDISRVNEDETRIEVYKIKKDGSRAKSPFYARSILGKETNDVYLYGFKDDDVFNIKGTAGGVKIKLVGVTGKDSVIGDAGSRVKVYKGKSDRYDSVYQEGISLSPVVLVSPAVYQVFETDPLAIFTRPGLHVGLGLALHPNAIKRDDLETVHNFAVNYGFIRKTFYVDYVGVVPQLIGKWDLMLKAKFDNPAFENYYGIGNETKDSTAAASSYYNVLSQRYYGGIGITRVIQQKHKLDLNLFYQHIKLNSNSTHYIGEREYTMPVFVNRDYAGISGGYTYSKTNDDITPTKGIKFSLGTGYIMDVKSNEHSFFKAMSSLAVYLPLGNRFSFATRVGGSTVQGDAEYYHLSKLGGNINLRGYPRERFYGKNSFYNNNELRLIAPTRNFFFSGKIGLLALLDEGRIWQPGETSDKWHIGYGGGIIVVPFNKVALTAIYSRSEESTQLQLKAGLFF